ncbi:hypothetical protein CYLTODRAFT_415745 [Cylindrobasidium torrendii FP15055 ss-10]|uniref:Uncharacterized protein n=1 Tax=Cylindrobasidium torrendii FP15055 ss-10 TaxID=1314674 RepID=A0A0D7AUN5_9AGAR|nr:hypothetical protein CYLTODRAFT_415745 [Cylindrobasidium torrendii FP15055 ss-10]
MSTKSYNNPLPGAANAPRFNAKDPQSLFKQYVNVINFIIEKTSVKDDAGKLAVFMHYATDKQKEEWECLNEYVNLRYNDFVTQLKKIYGKGDNELRYLQKTWDELINDYTTRSCNSSVSFGKFMLQVRPQYKYLEKNLQITNYIAVRNLSCCIDLQVWKEAISRLCEEVKVAAATPTAPYTPRNSQDPFTVTDILARVYMVFHEQERIATFIGVATTLSTSSRMPTGHSPMGIKAEDVDIKLEQFMQEHAKYRDSQALQTNQLQSLLDMITQLL